MLLELPEGLVGLDGGGQREKNWDNCNSIISKIYLKNKNNIFTYGRDYRTRSQENETAFGLSMSLC